VLGSGAEAKGEGGPGERGRSSQSSAYDDAASAAALPRGSSVGEMGAPYHVDHHRADQKAAGGRGAAPGVLVRHHYQDSGKSSPPLPRPASGEGKNDAGTDAGAGAGTQRRSSRAQMQPLRRRDGLPTLPVVFSPPDAAAANAATNAAAAVAAATGSSTGADPSPSLNRRASMNQHLPVLSSAWEPAPTVALARPRPTRPTTFLGAQLFPDAMADPEHGTAGAEPRTPPVTPPSRAPRQHPT